MQIEVNELGAFIGAAPGIGGGTPTQGAPGGGGAQGGGQQPAANPFGGQFFFIIIGLFIFMIVMSTMTSRKEKKKREEMLSSIGRHDRVMTSGGVIGTIVEVKSDEIVLKVDESTNTRIHFNRAAVQSVLKKGSGGKSEDSGGVDSEEGVKHTLEPAERIG